VVAGAEAARAVFLDNSLYAFFAFAARTVAQRLRVASAMAFLPAAESFRLGFAVAAALAGSDSPRSLAHLAFCARAIFRRDAAENLFRLRVGASGMAVGSER